MKTEGLSRNSQQVTIRNSPKPAESIPNLEGGGGAVKRPVPWDGNLTRSHADCLEILRALSVEPKWPVQACQGIVFPLPLHIYSFRFHVSRIKKL
jgi:hypothetical protein